MSLVPFDIQDFKYSERKKRSFFSFFVETATRYDFLHRVDAVGAMMIFGLRLPKTVASVSSRDQFVAPFALIVRGKKNKKHFYVGELVTAEKLDSSASLQKKEKKQGG